MFAGATSPHLDGLSPVATRELFCRLLGPLGQRAQEGVRRFWSVDLSSERCFEGHHAAIEFTGAVLVLLDDRASQFESGEEATGARVGQNLGPHLPIGIGGGVASDGTGGCAGISAEFELAGEQVIHAVLVHDQHDDVGRLAADLQAETTAADNEESRRAPAFWSAATGNAFAIAAAEHESSIEQ